MLRDEVRQFLREYGIPKTVFCRKTGISYTTLHNFLHGMVVSDETTGRIEAYLDKYKKQR